MGDGQTRMIIALNTNCHREQKKWPHFAELADKLHLEGDEVWFTGNNADKPYIENIIGRMQHSENVVDVSGGTNLKTLAMLMRRQFDMFVSINSGLLQMAIAMKVPTVAIIGGMPARMVVPFNNPLVRFAEDPGLYSKPCKLRMEDISVDWILELIRLSKGGGQEIRS